MRSSLRSFFAVSAAALAPSAACASFASSPVDLADAATDGRLDAPGSTTDGARPNFLYVFGGYTTLGDAGFLVPNAYRAPLRENGTLGEWGRVQELDIARSAPASIANAGGIVLAGGGDDAGNQTLSASKAKVVLGNVFRWEPLPPLTTPATFATGMTIGERVFVTGGTPTSSPAAPQAEIRALTTSSWEPAGVLPEPLLGHGLVVAGSRVHVVGGYTGKTPALVSRGALYAAALDNGGFSAWTDAGSLPIGTAFHVLARVDRWLFAIGGTTPDGNKGIAAVQRAAVQSDGTLLWERLDPIPATNGVAAACGAVIGRTIYVIGGRDASDRPSFTSVLVGTVNDAGKVDWTSTTSMPEPRNSFGCAAF